MRKIFFTMMVVILMGMGLVFAYEHDFDDAKQLIDSEISCDELSDEQLEMIGEYYMEQMHPGEAHEMIDKMMGGDGSESLKQMHIQMAKRLYCNEDVGRMTGGGMMNMMINNMMGSGMIVNWVYGFSYWNFINILYIILLIGLIILVYIWILKLWKNVQNKGGKK